mgnify:CR=1 FL=1
MLSTFITQHVAEIEKKLLWCGYWVILGIMSSVGLGTGLHTFVLYLVTINCFYIYIVAMSLQDLVFGQ